MTRPPDRDLVARARVGDRDACSALWVASRRWVAAVLWAHLPPGGELEDLLQEVAMRLVTGIRGLDDPQSFPRWLRSVAVNAARSAARKTEVRRRVVARDLSEDEPAPERTALAARENERARDALAHVLERLRRLPEAYREPLVLRAVDGLSQREIAAALGLEETTVESRLARGRRLLRQLVEEEEARVVPPRRIGARHG